MNLAPKLQLWHSNMRPQQRLRYEKLALLVVLLWPLAVLLQEYLAQDLGEDPVKRISHRTGMAALRVLLLCLGVTPAQQLFRWRRVVLFRRLLGLTAYFYASLHFATYVVLDQELDPAAIWQDAMKHGFVIVGLASLVLMTPLAITSTDSMVKRLGMKTWRRLHQGVYAAAALAAVHFLWLTKPKHRWEPGIYTALLAALLAVRVLGRWRRARREG